MSESREVLFDAGWSGHDEYDHVRITYANGRYYEEADGYCVYTGKYHLDVEVSEAQAMEIIDDAIADGFEVETV